MFGFISSVIAPLGSWSAWPGLVFGSAMGSLAAAFPDGPPAQRAGGGTSRERESPCFVVSSRETETRRGRTRRSAAISVIGSSVVGSSIVCFAFAFALDEPSCALLAAAFTSACANLAMYWSGALSQRDTALRRDADYDV